MCGQKPSTAKKLYSHAYGLWSKSRTFPQPFMLVSPHRGIASAKLAIEMLIQSHEPLCNTYGTIARLRPGTVIIATKTSTISYARLLATYSTLPQASRNIRGTTASFGSGSVEPCR